MEAPLRSWFETSLKYMSNIRDHSRPMSSSVAGARYAVPSRASLFVLSLAIFAVSFLSAGVDYARNFEIEYLDTHKLITVRDTWIGSGGESQVYALVPKEATMPKIPDGATLIRTPIERLVIMETVFLGIINDLDLYESLVGLAYLDFANDPLAHERVEKGLAKQVQSGAGMDIESMLMLKPELVLTSTIGSSTFDSHPQMRRAGLPVVVTAGYMEEHPLARTEWIKFVAAFYDKEDLADKVFQKVARRYEELVELAAGVEDRPKVFASAPYGGVWHVPGGKSYVSKAIAHAGAEYLWVDLDSKGGVPIDIEVVFRKAASADIWLQPSFYTSLSEILAADERFMGFDAMKSGRVYNFTKRVGRKGGYDVFERGVSHPEEVLADLIRIFHPELLPEHELIYYEKLE